MSQRALADRIALEVQTIKRLDAGVGSVATLIAVITALNFRLTGLGPGKSLPEQLRYRRHKRSLSLDQVAEKAGLSRTTVASLESGGGSVASLVNVLAVLAPRTHRRAPERLFWGQGEKADRDSRFTPPGFMDDIYAAFGPIDLDPCADLRSPVVARRRILLSRGRRWPRRRLIRSTCLRQSALFQHARLASARPRPVARRQGRYRCLPRSSADRFGIFHDTLSADADIFLLQGRVKFLNTQGKPQQTPFSLMAVALGATSEQKQQFAELVPRHWLTRGVATQESTRHSSADRFYLARLPWPGRTGADAKTTS